MELKELQKHWNAFGKTDPLWAIVSLPEKRFGNWDVEEFFVNGEHQIAGLLLELETRGIALPSGKALDFGCGVGRLTQALSAHFEECCGVDIAPTMIQQARRYNRCGERCRYFLNESDDLSLFQDGEFHFIYSIIVLQHISPAYIRSYLKEFLRILAPGGVAVFQLPGGPAPVEEVIEDQAERLVTAPLSARAFRAGITLADPPPRLKAGASAKIRVRVRNLGDATWPAHGARDGRYWIKLGNHWLDPQHEAVVFDDARSVLPFDLEPGAEVDLWLEVNAPRVPGRYLLEVDMVQEAVTWFGCNRATAIDYATFLDLFFPVLR
jgi:SAM-dependent methyltransferase